MLIRAARTFLFRSDTEVAMKIKSTSALPSRAGTYFISNFMSVALAACLASLLPMSSAHAQSASSNAVAGDALYRALGGNAGLVALMDDFMVRLLADRRMNPFFKEVDQADFKQKLVLQFCEVSGGPCKAKDPDMKKTHAGFDITKTDFNALVEVLQQSMDAQGIAFATQNRLLAQLAPMHRQIINSP
jgi:hemoglobin